MMFKVILWEKYNDEIGLFVIILFENCYKPFCFQNVKLSCFCMGVKCDIEEERKLQMLEKMF